LEESRRVIATAGANQLGKHHNNHRHNDLLWFSVIIDGHEDLRHTLPLFVGEGVPLDRLDGLVRRGLRAFL
jgi:hypothetical protein